jgi:hypothetical protein
MGRSYKAGVGGSSPSTPTLVDRPSVACRQLCRSRSAEKLVNTLERHADHRRDVAQTDTLIPQISHHSFGSVDHLLLGEGEVRAVDPQLGGLVGVGDVRHDQCDVAGGELQ